MADIWLAGQDVYSIVERAVANWHPALALVDKKIAVVFREKAAKSGGRAVYGKAKKAGPMIQLLGAKDYVFILEIAADVWQTLSDTQRTALIDHLLCSCGVNTDEESGEISYVIRQPEIQMFVDEVKRHGVWMPLDASDEDTESGVPTQEKMQEIAAATATIEDALGA